MCFSEAATAMERVAVNVAGRMNTERRAEANNGARVKYDMVEDASCRQSRVVAGAVVFFQVQRRRVPTLQVEDKRR